MLADITLSTIDLTEKQGEIVKYDMVNSEGAVTVILSLKVVLEKNALPPKVRESGDGKIAPSRKSSETLQFMFQKNGPQIKSSMKSLNMWP